MYRVIAYHGTGNKEVERDLCLLWESLCNFAKSRRIYHVYCFQAIKDRREANLLLVIQYEDNGIPNPHWKKTMRVWDAYNRIDYWFFVREDKRRISP